MRARAHTMLCLLAVLLPLLLAQSVQASPVARSTEAGCPSGQVSSTAETDYADVAGHQFEHEINCMTDYAIARGRTDGRYAPGDPVRRAQMALFLTRLVARAGVPLSYDDAGFTDLGTLAESARDAVNAVAHLGITRGVAADRFAPGETVTRGQMASFLARTHRVLTGEDLAAGPDAFVDDDGLVHEAAIDAIAQAGIGVGRSHDTFAPERDVTRGQMAAFLARTVALQVEAGALPSAYDDSASPPPSSPPPGSPASPGPVHRFTADGVQCTVVGTDGPDVLEGSSGDDVLCGLGGDDVLRGGPGDDVLDGGTGEDDVDGGLGNDDLDGGPDADVLDGGAGDNFCVPADVDVLHRCRYDETPPVIVEGSVVVTPDRVDVSHGDVPVTVEVRLQDDTGVSRVQAWFQDYNDYPRSVMNGPVLPFGELVSGSVRDGVWRFASTARRFSEPGSFELDISISDRVGREARKGFMDVLVVDNDTPDVTPPEVVEATLTSSTGFPVDVRSGPGSVTLTARITDDLSGVAQDGYLCLYRFAVEDYISMGGGCGWMQQVSGTALDGTYRVTVPIEARAPGGDWAVSLQVHDEVRHPGHVDSWMSPELHRFRTRAGSTEPRYRLLPAGVGDFRVVGTTDAAAAVVQSAHVTPDRLDTLLVGQQVVVTVHATDADGPGVEMVGARLQGEDRDVWLPLAENRAPTVGTRNDGRWAVLVDVPRGLPPGVYHLEVWVRDASHFQILVSPTHPDAGQYAVLAEAATVTVLESPLS